MTGYEIQYSSDKKNIKKGKIQKSKTLKNLKAKKFVYVRIRPYYKEKGAINPGKWTKVIKSKKKISK